MIINSQNFPHVLVPSFIIMHMNKTRNQTGDHHATLIFIISMMQAEKHQATVVLKK